MHEITPVIQELQHKKYVPRASHKACIIGQKLVQ